MSKKKVLIIDDNPVIIKMNETLLKTNGYDVISAMDGLSGLKMAQEEMPDIILLDIILPEMHGFEVCKKLKADPKTADIPIILVTASGLEQVAQEEADIPADGYIAKPFGFKDLHEVIEEKLNKG